MSIDPFAAGSYVTGRNTANLLGLKNKLEGLTTQMTTGRTAETYGALGSLRTDSLSAHSTISALNGYLAAISGATTRVSLATQSLTQVSTLGTSLRTSVLTDMRSTTSSGVGQSLSLARGNLDAAIDALNQQAAGRYLFGGRKTDTPPVVSTDLMLNGDPSAGLAGLKDMIAEQKAADLGSAGNGRLTQTLGGTTISLSEDPNAEARANFGFSLLAATSSNTGITANLTPGASPSVALSFAQNPSAGDRVRVAVLQPDGSQKILDLTARATGTPATADSFEIGANGPASAANLQAALGGAPIASVQSASPPGVSATFTGGSAASLALSVGTPNIGDSITLTVGLRDGTKQTITLTAAATADATSKTTFALGATPAATAANLSNAVSNALKDAGQTALSASSTLRASQNFFDGSSSPGLAPRRVDAAGTGYAEVASNKTVVWYTGDDAAGDARATASVQVGANRSVAIGARANEAPIRDTLAAMAALAAGTFTDASGLQDTARFQAAADRVQALLTPVDGKQTVADIAGEFGVAASVMNDAKGQAQSSKNTLQTAVDGIETISTEEVAVQLMSLQSQLQASYQVTAMLSKLSLVNYL